MKAVRVVSFLVFFPILVSAATLRGIVRAVDGRPVSSAVVAVEGYRPAVTDGDGRFALDVPAGTYTVVVTRGGFQAMAVQAATDADLAITLRPGLAENIVVSGIRAEAGTPVTKSDVERGTIERDYYGQDIPLLLRDTPSIDTYTEAGVGRIGILVHHVARDQSDAAQLHARRCAARRFRGYGDVLCRLPRPRAIAAVDSGAARRRDVDGGLAVVRRLDQSRVDRARAGVVDQRRGWRRLVRNEERDRRIPVGRAAGRLRVLRAASRPISRTGSANRRACGSTTSSLARRSRTRLAAPADRLHGARVDAAVV